MHTYIDITKHLLKYLKKNKKKGSIAAAFNPKIMNTTIRQLPCQFL